MEKTYLILIYMSRFVLIKSFCRRRYLLAVWGHSWCVRWWRVEGIVLDRKEGDGYMCICLL